MLRSTSPATCRNGAQAKKLKPMQPMEDHWIIVENVHMSNIVKAHGSYEFFSAHCHGFCRVPSRVMVHSWWLHQGAVVWIVLLHESERPEVQSLSSQVAVILTLHKSPAVGICCKGLLTTHLRTS